MAPLPPNLTFGLAWIAFTAALALHVADEAAHDFLSLHNPNALAIHRRLHIPFPPVFIFRTWLGSLIAGIVLLLLLSPAAFQGAHWLPSSLCPWRSSSASPAPPSTALAR